MKISGWVKRRYKFKKRILPWLHCRRVKHIFNSVTSQSFPQFQAKKMTVREKWRADFEKERKCVLRKRRQVLNFPLLPCHTRPCSKLRPHKALVVVVSPSSSTVHLIENGGKGACASLSSVRPLSSLRYFRADPLWKHSMNGGRDAQLYSFVAWFSSLIVKCTVPAWVVLKRILKHFNTDLSTMEMPTGQGCYCNKVSHYSNC